MQMKNKISHAIILGQNMTCFKIGEKFPIASMTRRVDNMSPLES